VGRRKMRLGMRQPALPSERGRMWRLSDGDLDVAGLFLAHAGRGWLQVQDAAARASRARVPGR
jgi:hypothetical protein